MKILMFTVFVLVSTNAYAGEVMEEKGQHTGAIADFLGKAFKPAGAPTGAPTGVPHDAPNLVPQGNLMMPQQAPAGAPLGVPNMGDPNTVPHQAPYMGHSEGSQTFGAPGPQSVPGPHGPQGVPHFEGPLGVPGPNGPQGVPHGAPHAPHFPQGVPTPCDKGAVPLG